VSSPGVGWEQRFSSWKGKASDSEQDRYERTCKAVGDALRASSRLGAYDYTVYAKGSYPNFTNVVRDSDVDIAVELTTFFKPRFIHAAEGLSLADVGFSTYDGDATLPAFKDDVQAALISYFGSPAVDRGTKAIRVAESVGRLPADVVPCVTERTWTSPSNYNDGIRLLNDSDPNQRIVNYPKQHLAQGTKKNDRTSRRYKRVVRILKRLENQMVEEKKIAVVPSFLIESCVWNVPDARFENGVDWTARVRSALAHIYNETRSEDCVQSDDWLEANALKYLFVAGQSWDYREAHAFAAAAWDYIGFE
jgi:hypothetical protein